MPSNSSSDYFVPQLMCDECPINRLTDNQSKVFAQDHLVVQAKNDEVANFFKNPVLIANLTYDELRAINGCKERHNIGACIVRFSDEVE